MAAAPTPEGPSASSPNAATVSAGAAGAGVSGCRGVVAPGPCMSFCLSVSPCLHACVRSRVPCPCSDTVPRARAERERARETDARTRANRRSSTVRCFGQHVAARRRGLKLKAGTSPLLTQRGALGSSGHEGAGRGGDSWAGRRQGKAVSIFKTHTARQALCRRIRTREARFVNRGTIWVGLTEERYGWACRSLAPPWLCSADLATLKGDAARPR